MTISYTLHNAGWATAEFSDAGQNRDMVASYLSDPLAEMAQAAICLLQDANSVKFSFDDEPGEHRCIVTKLPDAKVQIRVLWFEELWSGLPDERGKEVFSCCCSIAQFCGEVLSCLQSLLNEHGLEGYKQRWSNNDFPSDKFESLKKLVHERRKQKLSA